LFARQPPFVAKTLAQRAPFEIFHNQVEYVVGHAEIEHRRGVRVLDASGCARLPLKLFNCVGVGEEAVVQDLYRHFTLYKNMGSEVDCGHSAFADLTFDLILSLKQSADK